MNWQPVALEQAALIEKLLVRNAELEARIAVLEAEIAALKRIRQTRNNRLPQLRRQTRANRKASPP